MLLRLGKASGASARPALDGTAGVAAAYGVRRLFTAYAGPCLRLRRSSDNAEQDFGFAAGVLDAAAIAGWLGGATGFVAKWYDQSGSGRDAVQATAGNQPVVEPANAFRGCLPITSDGQPATATSKSLTIPSSLALSRHDFSAFCVLSPLTSLQKNIQFELNTASATHKANLFTDRAAGIGLNSYDGVALRVLPSLVPRSQPVVEGLVGSPSSYMVYLDTAAVSAAAPANLSMTGGLIGATSFAGFAAQNDYFAFVALSRALGAIEAGALVARLRSQFRVRTDQTIQLVLDGDSITEGFGGVRLRNNARQLEPLLSKPVQLRNIGIYGTTLATMNANKANVTGLYDAGKVKNICLIAGGSNDLASASAASVYASLTSYTTAVRAAGYKVAWATVTPRSDYNATQQGQWSAYNQLLRDNHAAAADGLVDYAAHPVIGPLAAAANPTYYPDGIHPSSLTYGIMAGIAAPVINALL